MGCSLSRIIESKYLLNIPESQEPKHKKNAIILAKISNFYYFSPSFALFCGHGLRKKLMEKYNIHINFTWKDKLMNIPTILFLDELIMILTIVAFVLFLVYGLLPDVKWNAYNKGYHDIEQDPFGIACDSDSYQYKSCFSCDQFIEYIQIPNDNDLYLVRPIGGCGKAHPVHCPLINKTGVDIVKYAMAENLYQYTDPNSFDNSTYMTYIFSGKPTYGWWNVFICNQKIQGEYAEHIAEEKWKDNFIFIVPIFFFYLILNAIMYMVHVVIVVYN